MANKLSTWHLFFILCATAVACAGPKISRTIGPQQIGTKYANLSGYFATGKAAPGGRQEEMTPSNIEHSVLLDEALLAKVDGAETCMDLTIRTESTYDEPLAQLGLKCTIGAASNQAVVEDERVSVTEFSYSGMAPVFLAEGIAADRYLGLSLEQPTEKVFRVVTRQGRVCCGLPPANNVLLELVNRRRHASSYKYKLAFAWTVR